MSLFGVDLQYVDVFGLKITEAMGYQQKLAAAKAYLGDKYILSKPVERLDK